MSTSPESELDLDLHFLPAWAQKSPEFNRYAKYEGGEDERSDRPAGRSDRRDRRDQRPGRADRPARRDENRPSGRRPEQPRGEGRQPFRSGTPRPEERREPAQPLPQLDVSFLPEEKGVESLARQIKLTGRAYPLFEIAQLILKKPDRYHVQFNVIKNAQGQPVQPLWVCNLDETVWLNEQDALFHVLKRHFDTFYQTERIPIDPPKGTYTFVAQCGMSGVILGPPNYHDYQTKLRKLHAERFSRVPFEVYKSRVKIARDEAIVKKWLEEQSFKTEFICLNVPEAKKLFSREEVEQHFRETHFPNIIRPVETFSVTNPASRQALPSVLQALSRQAWEEQRRFPLRVATTLSQQFTSHGLQFFKVNKTITHVAVARPHYLDVNATPVSEGVSRIVDFINATRRCTRRQLVDALAPATPAAPATTPETTSSASAPSAEPAEPTPEMRAVIGDLHWLIHQGHVIEFANGILETAKQPILRPRKPAPGPKAASETQSPADAGSEADQPAEPQAEEAASAPAADQSAIGEDISNNASAQQAAIEESLPPQPPQSKAETTPPSPPPESPNEPVPEAAS
jgi:hypothetical protein